MSFSFSVKTMGCKANIYDSLVIERELLELGGRRDDDRPDVFVLNSCTVTAEADRQSRNDILKMRRRAPDAWVVLSGCYAQRVFDNGGDVPGADSIVPNSRKSALARAVAARFGLEPGAAGPDPEIFWGQLPLEVGKTRAFLKIQEGCNDFCTYCIIPYARGASRSVPLESVLTEVRRLVVHGIHEIVITGTNIAEYGKEWGQTLEDLLEAILERTEIARVRLTSLDPSELSDRLLSLVGGRVMPHVHVSLQSPVSRVLRAMKRTYRAEEMADALLRIKARDPEIFVGMDVIAGFPSETESEHAEGLERLAGLPWTRLHVFPYSEREGTPALKIAGAVPGPERKRRATELLALSGRRHEEFAARQRGRELGGVLFENAFEAEGQWYALGHAPNYLRVMAHVPGGREAALSLHQRIARVRVTGVVPKPLHDWTLEADLL